MKDWNILKKELLQNPELRNKYEATELEYQIAHAVIGARVKMGYTQKQLADKLQTKQSVISRLESGTTTPSLSLLKRLAQALNTSLKVQFK